MNLNLKLNMDKNGQLTTKPKPKKRKIEEVEDKKAPAKAKKAPEKKTVPSNKNTQEKKPSILKKMYEEKKFADYKIVSQREKRFPCHMVVLAAQSSTVLRKKLEVDKEYGTNELTLPFANNVVEKFVRFFYDEEIKDERIKENFGAYMRLANQFELEDMKRQSLHLSLSQPGSYLIKCTQRSSSYIGSSQHTGLQLSDNLLNFYDFSKRSKTLEP